MAFRDGPFENIKVPLVWTAALTVVLAAIGCVLLLISDARAQSSPYQPVRSGVEAVAGPVGGVFAAPVRWFGHASDYVGGYFFAVSENRRLKRELADLQPWRDQAIALKNVNARYEAMLGIRPEPPVAMQTARSISDSRGPFSRARLIDAGSAKGVRIGNPVINEHGLVGRIVGTSPGVSRMLLLTDVASRTPVLVDRTDARALLTGDGSDNPRLEFVRGVGSVQAGDRILSSGDGGGFPRGVPIGVAAKGIDGTWRVKLFSDRGAIDYVRVMLLEDFGQLIGPDDLDAPPLAALGALPEATAAQAAAIADSAARRDAARARNEQTRSDAAAAAAATPSPPAPEPAAPPPGGTE
ncbi:rod shape-determining protein MreC [Brevundimonas sp.]|uniref:rod shape-determining protein MreC n=1 Tax=Brevundimonas sp. TaxID=1871086 RepID=UPI002737E895|nr:rod shape-determining protein MreC [Brevundimonas sp.]MDP3802517.1 rod shape-determining protein MreC [Brevundimonas sp.]